MHARANVEWSLHRYATAVPVAKRKTFAAIHFDDELIELVSNNPLSPTSKKDPMVLGLQKELARQKAEAAANAIFAEFDESTLYISQNDIANSKKASRRPSFANEYNDGDIDDNDDDDDNSDDDDDNDSDENAGIVERRPSTFSGFGAFPNDDDDSAAKDSVAAPLVINVIASAKQEFYDDPNADVDIDRQGSGEFGFPC